jgi:hypothetical protein
MPGPTKSVASIGELGIIQLFCQDDQLFTGIAEVALADTSSGSRHQIGSAFDSPRSISRPTSHRECGV